MSTPATPKAKKPTKKQLEKLLAKANPARVEIDYHFTSEEKIALGIRRATISSNLDELKEEKAAVMATFKVREKELMTEARNVEGKMISGMDRRPVDVLIVMRPKDRKKDLYGAHDHEFIREDAMTDDDFQTLPGVPLSGRTLPKTPDPAAKPEEKPEVSKEQPTDSKPKKDAKNAGKTNVGDVLDREAALKDAPLLDISLTMDWQTPALIRDFKKEAKHAKWSAAQISLMSATLLNCEDVKGMIETLRPHCKASQQEATE